MQEPLCDARKLKEDTVYSIADTDFIATYQCGVTTQKSILSEGGRLSICEACAQNRKTDQGWYGWFDHTMPLNSTWIHSRRFYEALLEAYKEEYGTTVEPGPGALYKWFQKNLAEGEKGGLEEELEGLKARLESLGGNKPDDMPFEEFLRLVKQRIDVEKQLALLTS